MANQQVVSPFGRLEHAPMDINGVRTFADFEVIEIVDDKFPYLALLGIDWAFDNNTMLNLKKRQMSFENDTLQMVMPLDPYDVDHYNELVDEDA